MYFNKPAANSLILRPSHYTQNNFIKFYLHVLKLYLSLCCRITKTLLKITLMKTATNNQRTAHRPTHNQYTDHGTRVNGTRIPTNGTRATDYSVKGITIDTSLTTGERVYIFLSSMVMAIGVVCGIGLLIF